MSVESFFHRRLKLVGHRWSATVQESIVDPLDDGREISYRAIRKCLLCGCIEKDWRVVDHPTTEPLRRPRTRQDTPGDWRLSLLGLALKPFALVAFVMLLALNTIHNIRGYFGPA